MLTAVNPRLAAALPEVSVGADLRTARVRDRDVAAGEPAELRQRLCAAIYDELHAGRAALNYPPGRTLRDRAVEDSLRAALPHREINRPATVLAGPDDEMVLVELDGIRLCVPRGKVSAARTAEPATIRLPADHPALSPGYFLADGPLPLAADEPVLRVYVHLLTMSAALDAWRTVLRVLTRQRIGYRAKVASWPDMLPRRDGLVVYLAGRDLAAAWDLGDATRGVRGIGQEVSVFAQPIAHGVAIAWEPADRRPGMRGLSFGEHRSAALADGLIRHAGRHDHRAPVGGFVRQALLDAGIDPDNPARNTRAGK